MECPVLGLIFRTEQQRAQRKRAGRTGAGFSLKQEMTSCFYLKSSG